MFQTGLELSELKEVNKEKPFNDLWPPVYLAPGYHYPPILRVTWYYWLKRGWVNNYTPYRDLKLWDYNPKAIQLRNEKRRTNKIHARRRYRTVESDLQQRQKFRHLRARKTRKSL